LLFGSSRRNVATREIKMMRTLTDSELDAVAGGLVAFGAGTVTLAPYDPTLNASIILAIPTVATLAINATTAAVAGLTVGTPSTVAATPTTVLSTA
jgi:hypothetical protein